MSALIEWAIFIALSAVAVITAAGLLVTMSMYRAGLALMSSFVALAGLFVLLNADLLAAIQIMMNVGGMLVMILFMVMIMLDPGGEMMWDMKRKMRMPGLGAFSMSMPRGQPPEPGEGQPDHAQEGGAWTCPMHPEVRQDRPGTCPKCGMELVPVGDHQDHTGAGVPSTTYTCPMHPEVQQDRPGTCPKCGMQLEPQSDDHEAHAGDDDQGAEYACPMHPEVRQDWPGTCPKCGMRLEPQQKNGQEHAGPDGDRHMEHEGMGGMSPGQHHRMMVDMAMSTTQLPWALAVGAATAAALIALVLLTPWPLSAATPAPDAAAAVGELLLSRYMIAFEGAAFMILAGIVAAVIFAKREGAPPLQQPAPETERAAEGEMYTCLMHPEVQQTGPGQCPICGMNLVPSREVAAPVGRDEHRHGGDA